MLWSASLFERYWLREKGFAGHEETPWRRTSCTRKMSALCISQPGESDRAKTVVPCAEEYTAVITDQLQALHDGIGFHDQPLCSTAHLSLDHPI